MVLIRRVVLVALCVLIAAGGAYGQSSMMDQIRSQLTSGGCTVQSPGLWATTTPAGNPSGLKITDGKVSRGAVQLMHGNVNVPIQPGQRLKVLAVVEANDTKNDLLRVTVEASGLAVPIDFVFPKGSLDTMPAPQVLAQVGRFLQPVMQNNVQVQSPYRDSRPVVAAAPVAAPQLSFVKWSEPIDNLLTKDVKAACESKENAGQALCYAVFATLLDAESYAQDNQTRLFGGCFPAGTTAQNIKDAFLAETQAIPDQLEGPMGIFYARTLDDKFSCPKTPPAKPRRPQVKK